MIYTKGGVELLSAQFDGFGKAFNRVIANEDMVNNTFQGTGDAGGTVCFAGTVPGDVLMLEIKPGEIWTLTRGSTLCWDPWVTISGQVNVRGIIPFGTDEGFVLPTATVAAGMPVGRLWISAFGRFDRHTLGPGETMLVDNGILLASQLQWERSLVGKGLFKSFLSGEGFGMEFKGPGDVYTQNRNLGQFRAIVAPLAPTATQSVVGGIIDAIAGKSGGGAAQAPARAKNKRAVKGSKK